MGRHCLWDYQSQLSGQRKEDRGSVLKMAEYRALEWRGWLGERMAPGLVDALRPMDFHEIIR